MPKTNTIFVCSNCGYESSKWLGKCPGCSAWSSFYEEKITKTNAGASSSSASARTKMATPQKLNEIEQKATVRQKTGFEELDKVLGGGLVKGSLILLGGEPGIGKSTLILQICNNVGGANPTSIQNVGSNSISIQDVGADSISAPNAGTYDCANDNVGVGVPDDPAHPVLYISGEESAEQIKIRADRLNIKNDNIVFLWETNIELIESAIDQIKPKLVIIDSIQTMYSEELSASPGSVSQVREITSRIMRNCKENEITTIIIGHVTKDGNIAGPRVLEHMVDVVLYLEGERYFSYRILRGVKNRFGSTNEIGMFEMQNEGMVEISNPSSILISEREENSTGSVIVATMEGTRPLLLELQVLTTGSVFGMPRRNANGIDYNRLTLLIAVLEKKLQIPLGSQDVYLNIVGGIKVNEPAIDLGVILAAYSSFKNLSIKEDVVVMGEVGLTGEVRRVNLIEKRIKEAEKLGFKTCIIPESNKKLLKENYKSDIIGVKNIFEAINNIRNR
ncbi:MAG: DNA repair protein RadA [Oscillospiraceae bacterium]|nr:DNA repair protein RadA [Oscillospiraceae bacterium]